MNTKNIFRMLLVAATLLLGANNVKAEETTIGGEHPANGDFTIDKEWFKNVDENWKLCIYFTITDIYQWSYKVLPNGHFLGKDTEFKNWEGHYYGPDNAGQDQYNGYNDYSNGHVELIIAKEGAQHLKDGGLTINAKGINISKISIVTPDGTAKTTPTLSFSENEYSAKIGVEFTEPELANPSNVSVTYSSDNSDVASVDGTTGEITIVSAGSANITAYHAEDDNTNEASASYKINVSKGDPTLAFSESNMTIKEGETKASPELINPLELPVTYSHYNGDYNFSLNSTTGEVTAYHATSNGVTINATFAGNENWNSATASYTLTIVSKQNPTLSFSEQYVEIVLGSTFTKPTLTCEPNTLAITYSSSNTDVAEVDASTGDITIKMTGTATITATSAEDDDYNEGSASYTISVVKGTPTLAFAETSYNATLGESFTSPSLLVTLGDQPLTDLPINYSSSNETVATVNETGEVTIVAAGTTTITAAFAGDDRYNAASASYTLNVAGSQAEKQNSTITFSGDVNMVFGTTFTAPEVSTTPENASLTYTTSNINVASIINNQVVPVGAGEATITATYGGNDEYNGTTATYKITVTAEVNNDALWYGAGYLGDWAAEERGSVGINIGIPDGTFASVEKGDTLRFHGKLGPLDANNWAIQLANGSWNGNIINIITGTDGFASGYYDVPVDTDELVAALKTNGSWGNCGYLQGYNLTITAITLRKYSSQVQPSETINGNWIASEQAPEAGEIIKDDDALTIRTVYDTTFGNDQSRSIHGKEFDHYITVRVDAEPSAENVTGTQKDTNTPITITAKQNTTVVFYYRRQSDNSNDWNFTANTGKDLKIVDQSEPTTLISGTLSVNNAFYNNDQVFGYVAKTYTLEAGKTYTVWAKGTTIQLYGIYYSTNANNVSVNTTYKITYYNGENIYCAIWLPSSASIPSLDTNPTKEGYTFDGWKDSDGNSLPSTMPAYDLTVYAQFTEDTPTQPVEEYIPVDMGDYEYRTYVTTRNIDFSESIGIKGYYATGLNNAGTEVQFTEVTGVVNSSVPLLLRKVEGATEYKLRISETEGVTPSPNKLVAGSSDYVGSSNIYVLTVHNGLLVFAETNYTQALVDGEHAYLDLRGTNARGRLRMSIGGNGDDTTGIEAIENEGVKTNTVYDLRGQRVEKPTKGLYIINGKKVYLK